MAIQLGQPLNPTIPADSQSGLSRWCQARLTDALRGMRRGRMTLTLPNGETIVLGDEPGSHDAWITIRSSQFYTHTLLFGHIGFAEAYMDGLWDTPDIANVIRWFILNIEDSTVLEGSGNKLWAMNLLGKFNKLAHAWRENTKTGSARNIYEHYDLGNAFFALFLDETMTYSSAKFDGKERSLEEAQIEKYDALCQKLMLQPSDRVLEIGSGWGGFALHAAKHYGCNIHTITISQQQYQYAKAKIDASPYRNQITLETRDYRELTGQYDKIVSIEMVEAVGDKFMEAYFGQCTQLLKKQGLFGIQMITCPDSRYTILRDNVDFIQKYIFPGSLLPSLGRVNQALMRTGDLFLYDLEDMGLDYAKTLATWYENFNAQLEAVKAQGFDERFIRKWNYYFKYCEAAFATRNISVVQAVYTHPNNPLLME